MPMSFISVQILNMRKKGKSLGSIACMEKIAASVLLKLYINSNEKCHTTDIAHK